jgi:predicted lipid carrier protein YhbT
MFGQDPELRWVTTFKSGKVRVAQWTGEKPDVQIQGDPATFILIFVLGKGSRLRALLTRRVKVRGSLIALRKLPTFFPKLDS